MPDQLVLRRAYAHAADATDGACESGRDVQQSKAMRFALACSFAAIAVLLVGCGGSKNTSSTTGSTSTTTAPDNGVSSKSADEIVTAMQAAVASATSVHIVGAGTSGGSSISLNLKLVRGKGGAGHISLGGLGFDIIRIGQKVYINASKSFLVHYAGSSAADLSGKWFYVSASTKGLGSLGSLTDIDALINQIVASHGTLSKGSTTSIDGQPAIAINDTKNGGVLYIATTGPAYPLELTPGKSNGTGVIKFTAWDQPIALKAPAHPLDYSKLGG